MFSTVPTVRYISHNPGDDVHEAQHTLERLQPDGDEEVGDVDAREQQEQRPDRPHPGVEEDERPERGQCRERH